MSILWRRSRRVDKERCDVVDLERVQRIHAVISDMYAAGCIDWDDAMFKWNQLRLLYEDGDPALDAFADELQLLSDSFLESD